ncbi:alpha-glucosidase [Pelagibacterium sediminicola]|uniref:beta-galactosidase BglA n=1 Tax=Pelagibacterium sediminicola TaxID=2248761 RepID=UPI000E31384D|nr:alpha-glucosidase [Pelagibacterium sediminicola]
MSYFSLESMQTQHPADRSDADANWWRGAVIYQIYPRSFQDQNGDGIGDLVGITSRLEYVADLGVDAVWLSPVFTSPMKDFGYDVSNYRDIDPLFGTLEDFDRLVEKAHALGLKVIIDQVISHSSDRHPWFSESRISRTNGKADWYVWADPKPDGTPPNNWLSIFGGSAWQWDGRRMQYYLHNFLAAQPDLNFHNPAVQDALLTEMRFWLERGVDGFRLDTVNFYFHSQGLEPNPPVRPEEFNTSTAPAVNPYNLQDHRYDKSQPENIAFLKRVRALLDEYPGTTSVGEIGDAQHQLEIMAQYTSGDDMLHMCYTFDFLGGEYSVDHFARAIRAVAESAPDGWICLAFSNHDVVRHITRWAPHGFEDMLGRQAIALLLTMRGSVCIYQGEELGLTEAELAYEDLADPYGIEFWPEFKGRDGCRTPMVWQAHVHQGGFSAANRTWLPVPAQHLQLAVDQQEEAANSMLHVYRAMVRFRRENRVLHDGAINVLDDTPEGVLAFRRSLKGDELFCAFNMSAEAVQYTPQAGLFLEEAGAPCTNTALEDGRLSFGPFGTYIGRIKRGN